MQDKKQMESQDARQKKGEMIHKTKQNWETRQETKKMERQDARQKEMGRWGNRS